MEKKYLGIDIGGTTIKFGVFDESGTLLGKWHIPTRKERRGAYILPDIIHSIRSGIPGLLSAEESPAGIGIGVPGPVLDASVVTRGTNLGWGVLNIREYFEKEFPGIPVRAANDVNAATIGEFWKGSGKDAENGMMVAIGTGIGGGVILNGHLVNGVFGSAGEVGHFMMREDETEVCGCGKKGCLEQYASATGIANEMKKLLLFSDEPSILRGKDDLTAKDVFDAAKQGDPAALKIADQTGMLLGKALSYVSCVIDPGLFIIGGGVSLAGSFLLDRIAENYKKTAFPPSRDATFRLAALGSDAGIYGDVKLVLPEQ